MKIELTTLTNSKLLLHFPTDPYADITIKSSLGEYQLQIAFLSIESEFFEEAYTNNTHEVDLSHLPQPYLEAVLKSLYGDSLCIDSFSDLTKYYAVVDYLRIGQYISRIVESLETDMKNLNPIELLQFCYSHRILLTEVKQLYLQDNLQILEDQKYYLQLNKIRPQTITQLLNEYYLQSSQSTKQAIIDSVLDNYFSRNKLDAQTFFAQNKEPELQALWQRTHQQMFYDKILHTQLTECDELPKVPLICDSAIMRVQDRVRDLEVEVEMQAKRIRELEMQNASYRETISELQKENLELRTKNKNGSPPRLVTFDEDEEGSDKKTNIIMVQSYMPDSGRKLEQSQVTTILHRSPVKQQDDHGEVGAIESPIPPKKLTPTHETKTMHQLKAQRNKKIFS